MGYKVDKGLYARLSDIFIAIEKSGTYSAGDIIDIINSHNDMHFGTKNLFIELSAIIMYTTLHNERIVPYLLDEYKAEIDFSYLINQSLLNNTDSYMVSEFFDRWKVSDNDNKSPTQIVLLILKKDNTDYHDILIDHKEALLALTENNVSIMFHKFTKSFMISARTVPIWKRFLSEVKELDEIMIKVASEDNELLEIFYPNALDIFIF